MWVNDQHFIHYKCHCMIINHNRLSLQYKNLNFLFNEFKISLQLMKTLGIVVDIVEKEEEGEDVGT